MGCLQGADILLPVKGTDMRKWAVIACDQFTSQPEYWEKVRAYVGDAPSTLHMIYPEAYLEAENELQRKNRIGRIQRCMQTYLQDGVLEPGVQQGYVLTARHTEAGTRVGLLAALDLETYDYTGKGNARVRATEATVQSRIPARVEIRKGAPAEFPHVMLLIDDAKERLLDGLYRERQNFRKLYDTELIPDGGTAEGYAIEGEAAGKLAEKLAEMEKSAGDIFLAVGDGNHSLAAAKACWETVKETLTERERAEHPARYALAEVVSIHSQTLKFHPIHRILFGKGAEKISLEFQRWLRDKGLCLEEGAGEQEADISFIYRGKISGIRIPDKKGLPAVEYLQSFLDEYLRKQPEARLDYVHSREAVFHLAEEENACGMLLKAIDRTMLFDAIVAGGVLPRKTFSIGEDHEKRYYIEGRRLA